MAAERHNIDKDELLQLMGVTVDNIYPDTNTTITNEDILNLKKLQDAPEINPKLFIDAYNALESKYNIGPNSTIVFNENGEDIPLLMLAVGGGEVGILNKPVADFLLSKGADIHKTVPETIKYLDGTFRNISNVDALIAATLSGSYQGVKYLLDKGANPAHQTGEGKTAFEYAVDIYNDSINNSYEDWPVAILRVFLIHPRVRQVLGDAEFNRIKGRMRISLHEAILRLKNTFNTQVYPYNTKQYHIYMNMLKGYLNIPKPNIKGAYNRRQFEAAFPPVLNPNVEHVIGSYIGPKAVKGFKLPRTETGLKHVNASLFQGGRKTRKQRKHKKGTRRRN